MTKFTPQPYPMLDITLAGIVFDDKRRRLPFLFLNRQIPVSARSNIHKKHDLFPLAPGGKSLHVVLLVTGMTGTAQRCK